MAALSAEEKAHLKRIHRMPRSWILGTQIKPATKRGKVIIHAMAAYDPRKPGLATWAMRQVEEHARYFTNRTIQRYFTLRPQSPIGYEEAFANVFNDVLPIFVQEIGRKGFVAASKILAFRLLSVKNNPISLSRFEKRYSFKAEMPGQFPVQPAGHVRHIETGLQDVEAEQPSAALPTFKAILDAGGLNAEERMVLRRRFGRRPDTFSAIARKLRQRSPQTVRNVEGRALEKLRKPEVLQKLGLETGGVRRTPPKRRHFPAGAPGQRQRNAHTRTRGGR